MAISHNAILAFKLTKLLVSSAFHLYQKKAKEQTYVWGSGLVNTIEYRRTIPHTAVWSESEAKQGR